MYIGVYPKEKDFLTSFINYSVHLFKASKYIFFGNNNPVKIDSHFMGRRKEFALGLKGIKFCPLRVAGPNQIQEN